ncbi:type I methionyl aminopeptidase [Limnochorda sp.]|uniref:type I methionyl aminopeptidase n=1 Tax=Limnochorda sp. TaxID=1940279 RepID=UPI001819D160|nr:type I methionyl aminopeptidase [Bacillota bacterium]MBO2518229.1 type I methionyl aminopeptidase [Bacillota bacterium]NMA71648.1 type I methionyl aminopeptidase [Bacillota bacterium]
MIILKSSEEIRRLRRAGKLVADAHALVAEMIRPGVTTAELDEAVEQLIRKAGGIPTFKGYQGFPASICTSVDDEVIHGIPGSRRLEEGQIVSVDIGVTLDGFVGDSAWTYPVGAIAPDVQRLLQTTEEALYRGIEAARPGNRISDIGHAIQTWVERRGFSVVRDFVGHGVGREMHEEPQVPNFGPPGRGPRIKPGMCLAIEPMVTMGKHHVRILDDQWTAVTVDGSLAAHFEHTIIVTPDGPEILTRRE